MKFTPEIGQQIINAIIAKLGGKDMPHCVVCNHDQWDLLDSFAPVNLSSDAGIVNLGGHILPSVVVVCKTCGNTLFFNLNRLGLTHLVTPEPEPPKVLTRGHLPGDPAPAVVPPLLRRELPKEDTTPPSVPPILTRRKD